MQFLRELRLLPSVELGAVTRDGHGRLFHALKFPPLRTDTRMDWDANWKKRSSGRSRSLRFRRIEKPRRRGNERRKSVGIPDARLARSARDVRIEINAGGDDGDDDDERDERAQ